MRSTTEMGAGPAGNANANRHGSTAAAADARLKEKRSSSDLERVLARLLDRIGSVGSSLLLLIRTGGTATGGVKRPRPQVFDLNLFFDVVCGTRRML